MSDNYVSGKKGCWRVVIGLEVHAQIATKTKLFSRTANCFGSPSNENVSFIDAAMPGMLPVLNMECVKEAVKTGIALNAQINKRSTFERKHYFYPDLPQGYQISQFEYPIVGEGYLEIDMGESGKKKIAIERLHIEQDAGKTIHGARESFVDLNRSGTGLMEIVTKPDLASADEVVVFFKTLRSILRCIGSCDGNMEEGNMRADVNVSVCPVGPDIPLGTRVEIKNLNSLRFIKQAIAFEVSRQIDVLEDSGMIDQETRLFDTDKGITRVMRSKEDALDYRYFPDPDLPPLLIDDKFIEEIRANLPPLPHEKCEVLMKEFGLNEYDAKILTSDMDYAAYFEVAVACLDESKRNDGCKMIANWMISELFALLKKTDVEIADSKIDPAALGELIDLILNNVISGKIAKEIFIQMWNEQVRAKEIVESKGLAQISDESALIKVIDGVLESYSAEVEQYKKGKDRLLGFFVGQIMKETKGQANPALLNKLLKTRLNK